MRLGVFVRAKLRVVTFHQTQGYLLASGCTKARIKSSHDGGELIYLHDRIYEFTCPTRKVKQDILPFTNE